MRRWPVMIIALAVLLPGMPVIARAQAPTSLTLTPNPVIWAGTSVTVTGEVIGTPRSDVQLSSSHPAATTLPASVSVAPNGRGSFTFTVSDGASTITIGVIGGGVTVTAPLTFTRLGVSSVTISPSSVAGGSNVSGTVTLNAPLSDVAGTRPFQVRVTSSARRVVETPGSEDLVVRVERGRSTQDFSLATRSVQESTLVTISARAEAGSSETRTTTVTVLAPELSSVTLSPSSVTGGVGATGSVTLTSRPPSGGIEISLSSSNTAIATVPASVTVASGGTTASFAVTTMPVGQAGSVSIGATRGGQQQAATLTVVSAGLSSVALTSASVTGGQASAAVVSLTGPAPPGGLGVQLSSDNTAVATVPASVTVAAGQTGARVAVTTLAVAKSSTVAISAAAGGDTKTASLTVVPPVAQVKALGFGASTEIKAGRSATGTVTLDGPAASDGVKVALKSLSTSLSVPAEVIVPAGQTTVTFTATAPFNAAAGSATVEALRLGGSASPAKATTTLTVVK